MPRAGSGEDFRLPPPGPAPGPFPDDADIPALEAPPVQPGPPMAIASVSRPLPAEPLPIAPAPIALPVASPELPAGPPVDPRPVAAVEPRPVVAVEPRPVAAVPATLPRAEEIAAPVMRVPAPETAIQTVLSRYRTAYRDLDAGAARAVWPSVDAKALRKAFDRLERQDLTFDSCQIAVSEVRAVASCRGNASYVPRVGKKDLHDGQRHWEFTLSKVDDLWLIETVSAR